MVKLILIISTTVLTAISCLAQSTPTPPTPPKPAGTSYSISISSDEEGDNFFSSTSVSIKKTEESYKLRASFNDTRTKSVLDLIKREIGTQGMKADGRTTIWTKTNRGEKVFECKLSRGSLRMYINKELASFKMYEELEQFGLELKDFISGSNSEEEAKKDAERAEKDLERAKRDLERAKRDLERAKTKTTKN